MFLTSELVTTPPGHAVYKGAARGAIREKRYNLSHPGVHHTSSDGDAEELDCMPWGGGNQLTGQKGY